MSAAVIVAPTDAQLLYIRGLCIDHGYDFPPAVHSKTEASEIIEAMKHGQYDPEYFAPSGRNASMGYEDYEPCEFCGDGPCKGCDDAWERGDETPGPREERERELYERDRRQPEDVPDGR